jgi:hypothetical protein
MAIPRPLTTTFKSDVGLPALGFFVLVLTSVLFFDVSKEVSPVCVKPESGAVLGKAF